MSSPHGPEQGPSSSPFEDVPQAPSSGARTVGSRTFPHLHIPSAAEVLGIAQGGQARRLLGRLGLLPFVLASTFIDYQGPANPASANAGDLSRPGQTISLDPSLVSNHPPKAENSSNPEVITYTEYTVADLVVFGESNVATLVNLPSGQFVATGELDPTSPDKKLDLIIRGKIPFRGNFVFASEDGSIMGVGGSEAPGIDRGKLWLMENGQQSVLDQDKGTVINGSLTTDRRYLITREADPDRENGWGYFVRDLTTKLRAPLSATTGIIGAVQGPITPVDTSTQPAVTRYKSYGSGWPYSGYSENIFDLATNTVSVRWVNSHEGSNGSKKLTQYIDAQGKHIVGIFNNDIEEPNGRGVAKYFHNEGTVPIPALDRKQNVSLYEKANDGNILNGVLMDAVVADVAGDRLFIVGGVQENMTAVNWVDVEVFSLSDPGVPSFLIPRDGTWPKHGKSGDPNRSAVLLKRGQERYLLLDVRSNQAGENGLRLRRITSGINSADVWETIIVKELKYKVFMPVYQQKRQQ